MTSTNAADEPGDIPIDIAVELRTSATAEQMWQVIWDLDHYADWNPECVEARWVDGATGPAVGACFSGRNEWNGQSWTVLCHIVECTSPAFVRWTVDDPAHPSSIWSYAISADDSGCTVVERFVHGPGESGIRGMIRSNPESAEVVVAVRTHVLRENMEAGLRALATRAELIASR